MRWIIATLAVGLIGVAQWAIQTAPPSEAVLVMRQNLPPGHRLTPSDIAIGSIPVPPGHGALLLPGSLSELVAGEYLTSPVLAGSPLLTTEIARAHTNVKVLQSSETDRCVPAKAV